MGLRKKPSALTNSPFVSPPLYGPATSTSTWTEVSIAAPSVMSPGHVGKPTKRSVTGDFRMGRTEDGKWVLGGKEYDTQEEMLSGLQDALDELYGPDEDMLGTGIFGPRKFP